MTTPAELAFTAGLMEGEGTVRLNKPGGRNIGALIVSCVNTDRQLIDWLNDRWPGYCKPATGLHPGQRPAFVWTIAARQALAFLEQIEPYVVTDRMRERIATARWWQQIKAKHWRYRTEADYQESFECWHWMAELNRRGLGAGGVGHPLGHDPAVTEAEWQATVVELAHILGWEHNHTRRSIGKGKRWTTATSKVGFPDLLLWHPGRGGVVALELKVGKNRPTPEQVACLASMEAAGIATMVAYPEDLEAVRDLLQHPPARP